jgi:putative heme-binding domain-containing protein
MSSLAIGRTWHGSLISDIIKSMNSKTLPFLFLGLSLHAQYDGDAFRSQVRQTQPLPPAQEQEAFALPEGFEISLFASEPEINKPMNMAFDTKGRLWITSTLEYPYPVKPGQKGRDSVKVLEDTDGDGKADKVTTFADGLNIPTGVYPYKDGVVVWSIPNIWYISDTDGDGVGDKREKLYGPLGYERDTHGMHSSFTRGYDGWLHITHGFNNHTTVEAGDGSKIQIQSGNTYRVRLDRSSVEQFTWGQVNPFGMCLDSRGYFYTADCHSSPVYQLIPGAYYPSFGKPHDGLGFAPVTITHNHGSTAICGVTLYEDSLWPESYSGHLFIGNVMTSRVNHDSLTWRGSSPKGKEEPDFIKTRDPWFRPVDMQLGPDGALYIADFYNRIIGHYEVPLDHPGRDRTSGRIWRVTYKGKTHPSPDVSKPVDAVSALSHPNITRRQLAIQALSDMGCQVPAKELREELANPLAAPWAAWVLHRTGNLGTDELMRLSTSSVHHARIHAQRILADISVWEDGHHRLAMEGLEDKDPHVRRAAANAISLHPSARHVVPLAASLAKEDGNPAGDDHLAHSLRIALRGQMREKGAFAKINSTKMESPAITTVLPAIALSVQSEDAAEYLLGRMGTLPESLGKGEAVTHIVRNIGLERMEVLARQLVGKGAPLEQAATLSAIHKGILQRGGEFGPDLQAWGVRLAAQLMAAETPESGWTNQPLPGAGNLPDNPWGFQKRRFQEGSEGLVLSSFAKKEEFTGTLRSKTFPIPGWLRFYICGHDGLPGKPLENKNFFRLRDASTEEILKEAVPPRNDVARQVVWDLEEFGGRKVFIEVTDGNNGKSYAWLAFARIEPQIPGLELVDPSSPGQMREAGLSLVRDLQIRSLSAQVQSLATDPEITARTKGLAKETLESLHGKQSASGPSAPMEELDNLIAARLKGFQSGKPDPAHGRDTFQLYCSACHKKGGIGNLVGPQLDGIGSRGAQRVIEDILDPNRNVDVAFRYTTVTLKDGAVGQGLKRREEGEAVVFADLTGREIVLAKSNIAKTEQTALSLMPSALGAAIPEKDFLDLVAFLMEK